jgi:hypothetical protein
MNHCVKLAFILDQINHMKKVFFTQLLFLLIGFSAVGQNYTVEFLDEQKSKSRGGSFIGMDEDGYVYSHSFRSFYAVFSFITHSYIKVFDSNDGRVVTEKRVDLNRDLSQLGYSYVRFMIHNNKPVFLCRKKGNNKEDNDYYFVDLDKNLNLISDPYKVGYDSDCKTFFKSSSVDLFFSDDKDTGLNLSITDLSCKTDDVVNLQAILRDKNNTIKNEFPLLIDVQRISQLSATIYDEHKVYIKVLSLERKKQEGKLFKKTERSHILLAVNETGEVKEIDLDILGPGVYVGAFKMVKSNNQLLFSGQIINEETKKFLGVFTGIIHPENDEITDINQQFFDSEFVERFWTERESRKSEKRRDKGKDDGEGFTGEYKLIDYFPTDDGGFVNFYQKYWVQVVTRTTRDANGAVYTTTDYYYHYQDLIPVKTNKDGDIEWVEIIPIRQVTVNYDPGTSFLATQKGEDVFIFYNSSNELDEMLETGTRTEKRRKRKDRVKSNATIAKISNAGEITFETVIDLREERRVYFNPGSMGVDEENNKIIMINNTKRKKSRLVVVGY